MKHFSVYLAAVLLPFLYSMTYYTISPSDCLGVIGGLTIWILAEYGFHRFAFHNNNLSPKTYELLAYNHAQHHQDPNGKDSLFLPLRLTMPVALALFTIALICFGLPFGTMLLLGMFTGLSFYEFVHYQAHFKYYNVWPLNYLTHRHMKHHFEHEDRMFGVTSPIMDWIFGTK
jgi:hypothetical protein